MVVRVSYMIRDGDRQSRKVGKLSNKLLIVI